MSLHVQILRENKPVNINWNWVTLGTLYDSLPEGNSLMSSGKHILTEDIEITDGKQDFQLKENDVIKAWR